MDDVRYDNTSPSGFSGFPEKMQAMLSRKAKSHAKSKDRSFTEGRGTTRSDDKTLETLRMLVERKPKLPT